MRGDQPYHHLRTYVWGQHGYFHIIQPNMGMSHMTIMVIIVPIIVTIAKV